MDDKSIEITFFVLTLNTVGARIRNIQIPMPLEIQTFGFGMVWFSDHTPFKNGTKNVRMMSVNQNLNFDQTPTI